MNPYLLLITLHNSLQVLIEILLLFLKISSFIFEITNHFFNFIFFIQAVWILHNHILYFLNTFQVLIYFLRKLLKLIIFIFNWRWFLILFFINLNIFNSKIFKVKNIVVSRLFNFRIYFIPYFIILYIVNLENTLTLFKVIRNAQKIFFKQSLHLLNILFLFLKLIIFSL